MSQETRPNEAFPIVPVVVFFVIVGTILFMLLPHSTPAMTESTPAEVATEVVTPAPTQAAAVPTTEATTEAVVQAESTEISAEATVAADVFDPASAYAISCSGCHGADGRGVEGMGTSLALSSPVMSRDVTTLVAMFTNAQPPVDPAQGFVHPYRGGYPEMTDEQLEQLMDYLFTVVAG